MTTPTNAQVRNNRFEIADAEGIFVSMSPAHEVDGTISSLVAALQASNIEIEELEQRRTELQAANTAEVERRRNAEKELLRLKEALVGKETVIRLKNIEIAQVRIQRAQAQRDYWSAQLESDRRRLKAAEARSQGETPPVSLEEPAHQAKRSFTKCRATATNTPA